MERVLRGARIARLPEGYIAELQESAKSHKIRYTFTPIGDIPWCSHASEHQERCRGAPRGRSGAADGGVEDGSHPARARRARRRLKGASVDERRARVLRFLDKKVWPTLPKASGAAG